MKTGPGLRVLMLAPEPFFEPRGTPFSVYHRAQALGRLGHQVDLVTYPIGHSISIPGVRIVRSWGPPWIKSVKIGPSLAKLPLDIALFYRAARMLFGRRYDCIHTHEEAGLFGAILGSIFGTPHLYDMHSDLAQQLTNFQFTKNRLLLRLMGWVQAAILRSARAVIVICPELGDTVSRITPGKPVIVIENGAIAVAAEPRDRAALAAEAEQLREELAIPSRAPVLLYTGTFEPYQGLDALVDSIPRVLLDFPAATFLVIGGNPAQVARLAERARRLGVADAVRLPGQRPTDQMAAFTLLADVLLSPRAHGTNTPLKIYAYLHAGKPILATNIRSHTQVLTTAVAMLVDPTPESLAEGALRLLSDPRLQQRLGREAASLAETNYGYETFLRSTSQAYAMLRLKPRPA